MVMDQNIRDLKPSTSTACGHHEHLFRHVLPLPVPALPLGVFLSAERPLREHFRQRVLSRSYDSSASTGSYATTEVLPQGKEFFLNGKVNLPAAHFQVDQYIIHVCLMSSSNLFLIEVFLERVERILVT
ncbi:hypothetical protein AVEN_104820-1 [Araneus ventricosus]|uniref:Uncharacterized protein n=1 Tax=Araneus ventricosus TaxID=182803 RepID=A0A4Y2US88_ARAVE|nr:hypothetical protein AVEN_104820-1 [Araneus ventricosus]